MIDSAAKLIIHVGYHKSASTYLQKIFETIDVNYYFFNRKQVDYIERTDFSKEVFLNNIFTNFSFDEGSTGTTIISHEELSGHPHGFDIVDPYVVADNLHSTFPDAHIMFIIRNQIDYLLSLYTYRVAVKGEEYRNITRFLMEDGEKGLFAKLEYDKLIQYYIKLFGNDRVLVMPMELLKREPEEFHSKVQGYINFSYPTKKGNSGKVNVSTKKNILILFFRVINRVFSFLWPFVKKMLSQQKEYNWRYRFYGTKQNISKNVGKHLDRFPEISVPEEVIALCNNRFSESNAKLGKILNVDLGKYGYC